MARWTNRLHQPFDWRIALIGAPGLPVTLAVGHLAGQTTGAVIAAGAAFTVGFGAARATARSHWYVMIGAAIGITAAAFVGTLAGWSLWSSTALLAALAGISALYVARDQNVWWTVQQVFGAAAVAVVFPNGLAGASERALLVAQGAGIQILCSLCVAACLPRLLRDERPAAKPLSLSGRAVGLHALRTIAAVLAATCLARRLDLPYGYWAPVTALLVLRPSRHDTDLRVVQRVLGTLIGVLLADAFAILVGNSMPFLVIVALAGTATLAYGLQNAGYGFLSAAIAATIVLMIGLVDHRIGANGDDRLLETLLGGAVALLAAWVVPDRPKPSR